MSESIVLGSVALECPDAVALAAGARRLRAEPGEHWRVYADPVGHVFCLTTEDLPDQLT